ncbi:hypothetical protein BC829DRAFT_242893 [Chytridium lagenaria]|nr:hypothetical protein BC829DRAFT_242893 [Chytridium lagenaria]
MDVTNGGVGLSRCSSVLSCNAYRNEYIFAEADINNPTCSSVSKTSSWRFDVIGLVQAWCGIYWNRCQPRYSCKVSERRPTAHGPRLKVSVLLPTDFLVILKLTWATTPTCSLVVKTLLAPLTTTSTIYALDSVNWTSIAPTGTWPAGIQNHGAAFRRSTQELIIIGGTKAGGIFNSDIWKYSLISGTWSFAQFLAEAHRRGPDTLSP